MEKTFKRILIGTSVLFFILIILGYASAPFLPINVLETLRQAFTPFFELTSWELVLAIFIHNALRALLVIFLGLIVGIVPFIFLVANSLIIGIVVYEVAILKGLGVALAALVPHGIIEIPAVILAITLGFQGGLEVVKWLLGKESQVRTFLQTGLKIFFKLIIPALFLASLIEVFITPQVLEALIK